MTGHRTFMSAVAIAICAALPASAQDSETAADTVVATVNGTEITLGQMIIARGGLPDQYKSMPDDVLFEGILDQLVQQTLLAQTIEDDMPMRVEMALENEKRTLLASEVVNSIVGGAVTEDAIQAAYEETYANADPEQEWNASHILVETEEDAAALVKRAREGEEFAKLAREHSTGPSGPGGGELGWFGAGSMVPDFEKAITSLEPEEISDPVKTQFGWHVIRLNETRLKDVPSIEDVRKELQQQVQRDAVDARVSELREGAEIDTSGQDLVDPAQLKNIDLLEQ
ncbi:MAG: peptidylprolyl isomerase [Sediminimonas qiaohouensis]|uniref:Parvulin-like PPIase n=1 Tax=Sediminimonas qiaohouensis TaxID=552061 RepID=A0A7C9LS14_9RHOB|nr:peptidylprolyl isomerase [Sediminimonas qiaohouensis]MTJ04676.1 peptidylprolyl isomerase [Sediminimonas qiaohouensis]